MGIIIDMRTRRLWKRKARLESPAVAARGEEMAIHGQVATGVLRRGNWEQIGLPAERIVQALKAR